MRGLELGRKTYCDEHVKLVERITRIDEKLGTVDDKIDRLTKLVLEHMDRLEKKVDKKVSKWVVGLLVGIFLAVSGGLFAAQAYVVRLVTGGQ